MDPLPLWDFDRPEVSLERFLAARADIAGRQPDDAILATQQARALGLVGRYDAAHAILDAIAVDDPEVLVRRHLERGRVQRSAGSDDRGRAEFEAAARGSVARSNGSPFGGLYIDALHMLAILPTDPAEQIAAGERALAAAARSADPTARAWQASLRNNLGMARHNAGDDAGALTEFRCALALREAARQRRETQLARYMVGWAERLLGRFDAARRTQTALRTELLADGRSDRYVARELELITARSTAPE